MDADAGIVFSTYDYGAAWGGKSANSDEPMPRERICQAQEFGLNIIAWALRRRRRSELCRALVGIIGPRMSTHVAALFEESDD